MAKWCERLSFLTLISLFAVLSVSFSSAQAQGTPSLKSLDVDLWPEYDAPEVLVIYRIVLSPATSLPVDLTFRIPASAGKPNAVAMRNSDGNLVTLTYQRQVSGEWALITFTATMPELQLEYYDPGLSKEGARRDFEFRWPGDYALDAMTIQVQQPLGATDLRVVPAADGSVNGPDGLTYFSKQVGALSAGQVFSLKFTYTKESDALSAASLQVKPSVPMTETPSVERTLRTLLPWIIGAFGLLLLVGGVVWYWRSGSGERETGWAPHRRRKPAELSPTEDEPGGYIYCHQCGKRAAPGDRFCRICGTKLRLE